MGKKYLVLCNRHSSIYGDNWALFWGYRDSEGGYNSDLRTAHRFDQSEISRFNDDNDIPIPIDVLGISEECEKEEVINKNIVVMIEKGTLNELLDLELKPLFQEETKDEIDKLLNEGFSPEEIAEKYGSEDCVGDHGMDIPSTCHEDANCTNCWIKCLDKKLEK